MRVQDIVSQHGLPAVISWPGSLYKVKLLQQQGNTITGIRTDNNCQALFTDDEFDDYIYCGKNECAPMPDKKGPPFGVNPVQAVQANGYIGQVKSHSAPTSQLGITIREFVHRINSRSSEKDWDQPITMDFIQSMLT